MDSSDSRQHAQQNAPRKASDVPPDSWKGTPPAEGTRRKLILDTIEKFTALVLGDPAFDQTQTPTALADEIESALLKQTIADESGEDPSICGRRSGKTEAMHEQIRKDAATPEEAEAAIADLEKYGTAMMLGGKRVNFKGNDDEAEGMGV